MAGIASHSCRFAKSGALRAGAARPPFEAVRQIQTVSDVLGLLTEKDLLVVVVKATDTAGKDRDALVKLCTSGFISALLGWKQIGKHRGLDESWHARCCSGCSSALLLRARGGVGIMISGGGRNDGRRRRSWSGG